jgi:hypothetical protein
MVQARGQRMSVAAAQVEVEPVGPDLARQALRGGQDVGAGGDLGQAQAAGADRREVVAEPGREGRVHVDDRAGRIDREEAGGGVVEIVDRVLEFLEDVLLALALVGDVAHRPQGRGATGPLDRAHADAEPGEGPLGRAARRRGHPDLLGMPEAVAGGLGEAVDRLRDLRRADEHPLHRAQAGEGLAAGDAQVRFVGVDEAPALLHHDRALGRGVDDRLGDVVPGGLAGELDRPDGEGEEAEHARHGEERQQPEDQRLGLLARDEGQAHGGTDEQARQHEEQPDAPGPLGTIDRVRRGLPVSAELNHPPPTHP